MDVNYKQRNVRFTVPTNFRHLLTHHHAVNTEKATFALLKKAHRRNVDIQLTSVSKLEIHKENISLMA